VLELYDGKLSCTVLRRESGSNARDLSGIKKVIDMTRRRKNSKYVVQDIPTEDYFQYKDLNSHSDLESLINHLIDELDGIIHFEDEVEDNRILYIDEVARPNKPWYEIVKIVLSHLVVDKLKTYDTHFAVITEGWPRLVESLNEYCKDFLFWDSSLKCISSKI
jgi:hypothetical protein